MKIYSSLGFKVVVILFFALLIILFVGTYMLINVQQAHLDETMTSCARRASAFVKQALLHSMQNNHQEDIRETVLDLGRIRDVALIRIVDKSGVIRYSTRGKEVFTKLEFSSPSCRDCHMGGDSIRHQMQYLHMREGEGRGRILQLVTSIENEPRCWNHACHAHSPTQTILGTLDVQMSLAHTDERLAESRTMVILFALLSFIIILATTALFVYVFVHKPVRKVIEGTEALSAGHLDYIIDLKSRDELGELAQSFNTMATDLQRAKDELTDWSNTLEIKVEEKSQQLNRVQEQVLHMDKMASLGRLSSTIAHELNNPLAGILTYAKLIQKRLQSGEVDPSRCKAIGSDASLIADEAKRCGEIVKNLLFFARGQSGRFERADVIEIINKSLRLIQHQIDLHQISVYRYQPPAPLLVTCDANQLQQAILALMLNAVEAMPDEGALTISLRTDDTNLLLSIKDTGMGIEREILGKIFEPFFTTKEESTGTGLGLSIVYGIIRHHGGMIDVDSLPGKGSTFNILLPLKGPPSQE